jgi:hypothetical protein
MHQQAASTLRHARQWLAQPRVWRKGGGDEFSTTELGCQCLVTATKFTCNRLGYDLLTVGDLAMEAVALAIGISLEEDYGLETGRWNDAPERTLQDVLEAMDRAITALEDVLEAMDRAITALQGAP